MGSVFVVQYHQSSQVQYGSQPRPAQAEVHICSSYTEGKKLIHFCILKIMIEAQRGNHDTKTVRAQAV